MPKHFNVFCFTPKCQKGILELSALFGSERQKMGLHVTEHERVILLFIWELSLKGSGSVLFYVCTESRQRDETRRRRVMAKAHVRLACPVASSALLDHSHVTNTVASWQMTTCSEVNVFFYKMCWNTIGTRNWSVVTRCQHLMSSALKMFS